VCPTRYRTRHFFNNFSTNEDIAKKFEADYRHIPLQFSHNERTPVQISVNIFIGVTIIKEMPSSGASGTHCSSELVSFLVGLRTYQQLCASLGLRVRTAGVNMERRGSLCRTEIVPPARFVSRTGGEVK